jgi:hypothetical protein
MDSKAVAEYETIGLETVQVLDIQSMKTVQVLESQSMDSLSISYPVIISEFTR